MKSYNDENILIETTPQHYEVVYNNDEILLRTGDINKAIKRASECAKCAETNCSYQVFHCSPVGDRMILQYKVKVGGLAGTR